ncbi:CAP domain-containing protein [Laspinema palackyanum]|uniref:CAP domain-containing protein n=1 Tax=Laspinema palackyanum TaxID=3231601 RepID=UPI00345CC76B|nr:CAP domain-containing protein [Laspinema sp. D2c]
MKLGFLLAKLALLTMVTTVSGCQFSAYLEAGLEEVGIGVSPQPTTPIPASSDSEFSEMEQRVHELVNQYRQARNLPPLTVDERISIQARKHSEAMAQGEMTFSHDGFDNRIKAIGQSLSYRRAAENLAYNMGYRDPVNQAVEGWIGSPGHEQNMVGAYDLTGIGIAKNAKGEYYYSQIFIKGR